MRKETAITLGLGIGAVVLGAGLSSWGFSEGVRKRIKEEQGRKCADCGRRGKLQVHHKVPRSQDGSDTLGNAVALCPSCHHKWDIMARRGIIYPGRHS